MRHSLTYQRLVFNIKIQVLIFLLWCFCMFNAILIMKHLDVVQRNSFQSPQVLTKLNKKKLFWYVHKNAIPIHKGKRLFHLKHIYFALYFFASQKLTKNTLFVFLTIRIKNYVIDDICSLNFKYFQPEVKFKDK